MEKDLIYLDHAAATPLDAAVLKAMQPFLADAFFNPSATYMAARAVKKSLEEARTGVAYWLGAKPSEVVFTAGATEANNLGIHGVMRQHPDGNMLVSAIEHESVLEPARQYNHQEVKVDATGRIDLADLQAKIDDDTVLVCVMYANNEIGTVQPIKEVAAVIAAIRRSRGAGGKPLYFLCDAAQAGNYLALHVSRLGVDMMSLNGGKIYGPKQSGCLFVKAGMVLEPMIYGGGQERNLRSGTENVAGIVGFYKALEIVQAARGTQLSLQTKLQQQFFELLKAKLPEAVINGNLKKRLPNNIHVTFPGIDNERLLIALDEQGILASAGSACSASDEESSHVLRAIGKTDTEARSSIRFSTGRHTEPKDIERTVDVLLGLIHR